MSFPTDSEALKSNNKRLSDSVLEETCSADNLHMAG